MHFFEPNGFEKDYECVLKEGKAYGTYIDPDGANANYYNLLAQFLNKREKKLINKYYFLPPKKASGIMDNEKESSIADDSKIMVLDKDSNKEFMLTSDLFGFSADENIFLDKSKAGKYPLSKILKLSKEKGFEKDYEANIHTIIDYVKNTRTLGGAFVWPTRSLSNRGCQYNMLRGVNSYIEDRVDLTLLEIKHVLDSKNDKEKFKNDILHGEYIRSPIMNNWLNHFDSFDQYVSYFMLEEFVDPNTKMPINIMTGKKFNDGYVPNYNKRELRNLDNIQDLIEIINRVKKKIVARTMSMEK